VGLANLGSESETCVGNRVHLVGVSISIEKNFYRLPFTPPLSGSLYRSFNLELEFKEVREAAAAEKKKLEDELAGEKRKAVEATMQFNTAATGRSNAYPF
jgi:hypothetical protein